MNWQVLSAVVAGVVAAGVVAEARYRIRQRKIRKAWVAWCRSDHREPWTETH